MKIVPKNWRDFQHYKDRNPPWIRLHKALLDNFDFHRLPVASRALAPMLWLLASDSIDGVIDADHERLAFRLRMTVKEVADALKPLIDKGFFELDSTSLADCKQVAVPEAETEALQRQSRERSPVGSRLPSDFEPEKEIAISLGLDYALERAKFSDYWQAVPGAKARKSDWPATWRNWCRNAKPPVRGSPSLAAVTVPGPAPWKPEPVEIQTPEQRAKTAADLKALQQRLRA